jgi:hypothetical protein
MLHEAGEARRCCDGGINGVLFQFAFNLFDNLRRNAGTPVAHGAGPLCWLFFRIFLLEYFYVGKPLAYVQVKLTRAIYAGVSLVFRRGGFHQN